MKRLYFAIALLLPTGASPLAQTPNYATGITLANLLGGGVPIASARVCATPADAHGSALTFSAPTWGVLLKNHPFCGTVTNGALTAAVRVPDACHTNNPAPITYNLSVQPLDSAGNPQGTAVSISAVPNICGANYALDAYAPVSTAALPASPAIGQGVGVPPYCTSPSLWIETGGPAAYICKNGVYAPVGSGAATALSLTVGSVSTLPAGAAPTVTNSGTASSPVLNFGFPAGGLTTAQALTAAADGSFPASQFNTGGIDYVANALAANPAGSVIPVGPSVSTQLTVFPTKAASVIHDTRPGAEGNRYYNCLYQQQMHNNHITDASACAWEHVTFDRLTPGIPSFRFLKERSYQSFGLCYNFSSAWCVDQIEQNDITLANRGIGGGYTIKYNKQAAGDSNVFNLYSYFDAGWNTQSDEGMTGIRNYVTQNQTYWHGTTTSSGTGLTMPVLTDATSGRNHTTDGAILLNISRGTISGTITGPAVPLTGSGYLTTYPTSLTNLPLTTAWGICPTSPPSPASPEVNAPFTCTVTLKAGTFTAGGFVWVAGPNYPEQAAITAVGAASGGTQSITISVRNPQPDAATKGVAIFQGGTVGQYTSWDANLAQPAGLRTTLYAFGSLDGVNLITAFYAQGGTGQGHPSPPGCNAQAFCPGVAGRNGFHLYPGAEIVANLSLAHNPQLEPNGVVFAAGDLLENPPSDAVYMTGTKMLCQVYTPMNGSGSVCDSVQVGGQGAVANFYPRYTQNQSFPGIYAVNGGLYQGMTMHRVTGYYDQGETFDIMPGVGLFTVSAMNYHQFFGDGVTTGATYGTLFTLPHGSVVWDDANAVLQTVNLGSNEYVGMRPSAPSGPCVFSHWQFTMDGRISDCSTGTWGQHYPRFSDLGAAATHGATITVNGTPCTLDGSCTLTKGWSVQPAINGGGVALAAKAYPLTVGYNDTGQTVTITGIRCYADTGSSTMAVASFTAVGGSPQKVADLLASPITCGTSFTAGTQSSTVTLAAGNWLVFTITADGTSTQVAGVVTGVHP